MTKSKEKLLIIDGSAVMYRAWHALPPFSTKDGRVVNAVYGFLLAYFKLTEDIKPTHILVAFDLPAPTVRHEQYADYKAGRPEQPPEFYAQFDILRTVLDAFKIARVEMPGFEADDIIGTATKLAERDGLTVVIATSDLDTLQLVNDNVTVQTFGRSLNEVKIYNPQSVQERFLITPAQVVDYRGLKGDPSDNIPGVPGIGEKTAGALIEQFDSLENLYATLKSDAPLVKPLTPRLKDLLLSHEEAAFFSRTLSTMHTDLNLPLQVVDYKIVPPSDNLVAVLQDLEFKSILQKLPPAMREAQPNSVVVPAKYVWIKTESELKKLITNLKKIGEFAFDTETTGLDVLSAKLVGMSFSWEAHTGYYVHVLDNQEWLQMLAPVLKDAALKKWGHNIKYDWQVLKTNGFELDGVVGDTMIAAYLLNPGARGYKLDDLAFTEFGHKMISITELIGEGENEITMAEVEPHKIADYAAEDADYCWQLKLKLAPSLKSHGVLDLFKNIEVPLIPVLGEMELNGIKVDSKILNDADKEVMVQINKLEKAIYKLAGEQFNIASPKQLKVILFDNLKLPTAGLSRTKTGISTAADELEKLRGAHDIIPLLLEYRELTKLHSTYLDALPKQIHPSTGRVHTTFNQTIAATGRLSSIDPNLQNIPVRTEGGEAVRRAFVAPAGKILLAADYSQFELRIVASLAHDEEMIDIFKRGEDIHTATAAKIHGLDLAEVTKQIRYTAKEINFGVMYGMGAWGLSKRTGLTPAEAKEFIDKYFATFAGLKKYIDNTIAETRARGYAETMFGRRRYLPDINSGVAVARQAAERMAINLPIQGTQADIIKLAMIKIANQLHAITPSAKMLLQVHDELIFEVDKNEADALAEFVKKQMEAVVQLEVPVVVNVSLAKSWGELK